MSKTLSTILVVLAVILLAGGLFFAGTVYARASAFSPAAWFGSGWNQNRAYGPGMMGTGYSNSGSRYSAHSPS